MVSVPWRSQICRTTGGRLVAAGGRGWGLGGAGGTAAAGAHVCAARGAVLRPGGRRALLCARTCATCCWARDCTVPGGPAGAATCARPGRAVTGGVRWGVRGVCAGGVGARPRRDLRCRVSAGSLVRSLARSLSLSLSPRTARNGARVRRSSLDKVDRTFHGHKVTKQEHSGMVAHLQTFHAVVDAGCRDAPPRILCTL